MKIEFANEAVAKRFECNAETDITINTNRYHGNISAIDEKTAEYLFSTSDPLIKEKAKVTATK